MNNVPGVTLLFTQTLSISQRENSSELYVIRKRISRTIQCTKKLDEIVNTEAKFQQNMGIP